MSFVDYNKIMALTRTLSINTIYEKMFTIYIGGA